MPAIVACSAIVCGTGDGDLGIQPRPRRAPVIYERLDLMRSNVTYF